MFYHWLFQGVVLISKKLAAVTDIQVFLQVVGLYVECKSNEWQCWIHFQQISQTLVSFENRSWFLEPAFSPTFARKVSLELRYGREDEEMMGLQFCNEMGLLNLCIHPDKVPPARKPKMILVVKGGDSAAGSSWIHYGGSLKQVRMTT